MSPLLDGLASLAPRCRCRPVACAPWAAATHSRAPILSCQTLGRTPDPVTAGQNFDLI